MLQGIDVIAVHEALEILKPKTEEWLQEGGNDKCKEWLSTIHDHQNIIDTIISMAVGSNEIKILQ